MNITEKRIREFFSQFPNGCETYKNGKKNIIYTFEKKIDNKFNISYHLNFPEKNVTFNFWFEKNSFFNRKESVTISFYNGNEIIEKNRLKNILTTSLYSELELTVKNILLQNE